MLRDEDPKKVERVMAAMLQMKKIDIQALRQAYWEDEELPAERRTPWQS